MEKRKRNSPRKTTREPNRNLKKKNKRGHKTSHISQNYVMNTNNSSNHHRINQYFESLKQLNMYFNRDNLIL